MLDLKRILVVIEPDAQEQPALDRAVQIASYADVSLELLLAEYTPYLEDGYYFDPTQAQQLRAEHGKRRMEQLHELAAPLQAQGLNVVTAVAWGNPPYAEIVSRAKESQPSLVIKSTRQHSKLARVFLANDDWELVRYCPAPLLLAKGEPWAEKPVFMAAVDPNHVHDKPAKLDARIVAAAKELAGLAAGEVKLFHSSCLPPLSGMYTLHEDKGFGQQQLEELAESYGLNAQACLWSDEEIETGMAQAASGCAASAVVMGAISRSRLDRVLIGNTAERVMDKLDCDVLVVKPTHMPALGEVLL